MVRGFAAAVAKLKRDLGQPVTAEVDGMVLEIRYKGRRTADDIFQEIGPWEGESSEELMQLLRESRERSRELEAGQEPPSF